MKNPKELQALARILGGIPIWGVLPGSAAHQAGMRYGDIVVRVNGIETPNVAQYLRAHDSRQDRIEFQILRQGTLLHLGLKLGELH